MTSASVSDFDFIMTTILCQRTDSPIRKAFLRDGITDIGDIMCLGGRCIARLKFPDDSSGTIVLEKLADGDQQLIHCFAAFVMKKIADGNPIHSDWQNLAEITEFQEFKVIGYASYYNAWCHWYNVSCNETYHASYTASNNALDNDRDTDRFDLNNDNGITTVVIPSEPSRLGSRFSSLTDDLFKQHVGIDSRLSASADYLNSRQSSSVVDCCVDPSDSDNGIAVVVAADPIPNDTKGAIVDPLAGENASEQVKPSESSRVGSRLSASADDLFEDDPIPSEPPGFGSCQPSLVVDCCVDNGIAVLVVDADIFEGDDGIADPIPSEPTGLGSRQSHDADDVFEGDDGIADSIPGEPTGLGSRLSASVADIFGLGADTLDPLAGEYLPDQVKSMSRSSKDLFDVDDDDDGITEDSTRFQAGPLNSDIVSRIWWTIDSVSAATMDSRILLSRYQASLLNSALDYLLMMKTISSISTCRGNSWGAVQEDPSEPKHSRLGSRLSRSADEYNDGIADTIPIEPPELRSRLSSTVCKNSWRAVQADPREPKPSRLGSRISRATDEYDNGIAALIPSEPPEIRPPIPAAMKTVSSVSTCRDNNLGAVQEDQKPSRLGYRISRSVDECNDGIADTIPSESPELRSRLSSTVCKSSWGAAQEDPKPSQLSSRIARATDEYDDGIADLIPTEPGIVDSIPSEPPELRSRLSRVSHATDEYDNGIAGSIPSKPQELRSRLSAKVYQDSWGAVQEDPSDPEADPVKPSDSRPLTSSVVDCHVVLAFGSDDDHVYNDGIADSIPSEPPEEFGSRVSSSTEDLFEDDTIPSNPEADPVKPSDSSLLTSSVVDCRVVLAFGSDDNHGINANANAVTVDHRTVMIDHRMIRGAVTTTVMRQMRTLTYEETRVVRSTDECDDGIVDSIPNEPPDISTTTVCLLRFIRINSGEKLAAKTLPFVHVPGAINPADMLSKHWGHQQTWTQLQALLF
jgi:hypothetical protein